MQVAPGVSTSLVDVSLSCRMGGEFKTALNMPIFRAVWNQVFQDGRYRYHDWTVKADPDCVFFPQRLRPLLLQHHEAAPGGTYLNNCKLGMHGPLEVFSRNAVQTLVQNWLGCEQHFQQLCSGDCRWGEDMFVDQCLWKVMHVQRDFEGLLLREDHCHPPPGWDTCSYMPRVVAFHPFKTVGGYKRCMQNAAQTAAMTPARVLNQ